MTGKTRPTSVKESLFVTKHESLTDILCDHDLASLGDAYVNLVYSLALSRKEGKPVGRKADSYRLSLALRQVGLRKLLPSRTDRHKQADAAEALIVYGWLMGTVSLEAALSAMEKGETEEESFVILLRTTMQELGVTLTASIRGSDKLAEGDAREAPE